jgi:two-component system, OmpR family, sensor histidine kinase MprB
VTLRARIAIAVAVIVACAIASASVLSYQGSSSGLREQVDEFLDARSERFTQANLTLDQIELNSTDSARQRFRFAEVDAVTQVLDRRGGVAITVTGETPLPVAADDAAVATGTRQSSRRDVTVGDEQYRMLTVPLAGGGAVQIARSLSEIDAVLDQLRIRLLVITGIGTALAALIALAVARRTAHPIEHLRDAVEKVTKSGDLTGPIEVTHHGGQEVDQLTVAFNRLLAALAQAREQQARLVADASHELRTPLTAVRTNIEFLERATTLTEADRQSLLAETRAELEGLTDLVSEMVELATDSRSVEPFVDVDLPDLASDVAARFARRSGRLVTVALGRPCHVRAQRGLLDRAIANLVDNALKYSAPSSGVEVTVDGPAIEVADRGSGIAPHDESKVFERFYRADNARTRPGSGLGLSIVAQIADGHSATVTVHPRPGGGTIARFALPEPSPSERSWTPLNSQ